MTSLRSAPQPPEKLKHLLDKISDERLRTKIDQPLFHAASMFPIPDICPVNQQRLIEVAGAFIQHLYEHALLLPQTLSEAQARAEALHLIETAYQGTIGVGLGAALADAQNRFYNGLAVVLNGLTDTIRQRERQTYIRGMLYTSVDASDWSDLNRITQETREALAPYTPNDVESCACSQMAGAFAPLILLHSETDRILADMVRPQGPRY